MPVRRREVQRYPASAVDAQSVRATLQQQRDHIFVPRFCRLVQATSAETTHDTHHTPLAQDATVDHELRRVALSEIPFLVRER